MANMESIFGNGDPGKKKKNKYKSTPGGMDKECKGGSCSSPKKTMKIGGKIPKMPPRKIKPPVDAPHDNPRIMGGSAGGRNAAYQQ